MRVRMLDDGLALAVLQEDHTDVSAQFAAHWGNERFDKLRPYESMVFGTQWHDSGYREWEGKPPVNVETGLPEGRGDGGRAITAQLQAHVKNIEWVRSHDPLAGLMVSMHRTGLWQTRYSTIKKPEPDYGRRTLNPEIQRVLEQLEASQKEEKQALGNGDPNFERDVWVNYRLLQLFDILSLYFCGNGIGDDGQLKEQVVAPIPVGYGTDEEIELHLIPSGDHSLQVDPYPFDASPICIGLRGRLIAASEGHPISEEATREVFYKAPRRLLEYEIAR